MKKSIIASVIALGMMGGVAHADDPQNTVIFHGAVSTSTCDVVPSLNGTIMADSTIALGTVAPGDEGEAKEFVIKAKDSSAPECQAVANMQTATVSWSSNFLNANGLIADAGNSTAKDAQVLLSSENSNKPGAITASDRVSEFTADKIIGEGLKFSAKAKGGAESGTFQTAASFSVAYK